MTTKNRLKEGAAAPPAVPPLPEAPPPLAPLTPEERVAQLVRLYLPCGRGSRGKSTWARWLIARLLARGERLIVADADRTNSTLSRFFPGALRPDSADEADVVSLVRTVIENIAAHGVGGLVDFGGGDLILKTLARTMDLQGWLPEIGIEPVLVHFLGAASDDLSYLGSLEETFAPTATAIVLNQVAVPPNTSPAAAFAQTVQASPVLAAALNRGARLVLMPRLDPASAIEEAGMTFADAALNRRRPDGGEPLGLWRAQQTRLWLRAMDAEMDAIKEWL